MANKLSDINDWNYHKNEFIKLGGIVENLTCREGGNGRGIFRVRNNSKSQIVCPPSLLIKIKDIKFISGKLRVKEKSGHSIQAIEFIENYYESFSWSDGGKEEAKFLKEITQIPKEAKSIISKNNMWQNHTLNCEPSLKLSFQRFIDSRVVSFQKEPVLAPIWELINHSPFASSFKTSNKGVGTPTYPLDQIEDEILFSYKQNGSPLSIFFGYGFASNEICTYSLPREIKTGDKQLTIRVEGGHAGVEKSDSKIISKGNTLTIPSLPLGSISKKLPRKYFYSIVQKHGISESEASNIFHELQLANIEERERFINILNVHPNDTVKILIESVKREKELIQSSLQAY